MYDFKLNNKNASEMGVYAIQRPNIPTPKKRIEQKSISGRNGILTIDDNTFEAISFEIECNFMSDKAETIAVNARKIRSWIYSHQQSKLSFNDDANFFYKTQIIEMSDVDRTSHRIGIFTLNCTCDPFTYLTIGEREIDIIPQIINLYYTSTPIYKLTGNGVFKLTVNGNEFTVNVSGNAVIDSNLMLIYREDNGQLINQNSFGKFEDLWLKNGNNPISISKPNGGTVKIIPNWRTI